MRRYLTMVAAAALLTACGTGASDEPWRSSAAAPATHAITGQKTAVGNLAGANGHATGGEVAVFKTTAGYVVSLGSDFSLDGAPDPHVSFGDATRASVTLAPLASNTGAQIYGVPAGVDVGQYRHVYIWCDEFDVSLGVAELDLL